MADQSVQKGKLTGRHVLFMIVAFFGVMIVANVIFIRAAIKTYPGVTEEKSYAQGVKYNETLASRAAQSKLGWAVEVTEVERDGDTGRIILRMAKGERALTSLALEGALKRPAHSGEDQALAFKPVGGGLYEAEVSAFAPGAWDLAVRAENGLGEALDVEARIIAP